MKIIVAPITLNVMISVTLATCLLLDSPRIKRVLYLLDGCLVSKFSTMNQLLFFCVLSCNICVFLISLLGSASESFYLRFIIEDGVSGPQT